jgi:hypothetical protein
MYQIGGSREGMQGRIRQDPKGGITSADSGVSSRFKLSRYLRCSKADIDNILSAFTSARANPAIK